MDPNSLSNVHEVSTKHIHLNLKADFERKALVGSVCLSNVVLKENVEKLVLDSRYLLIKNAEIDGSSAICTQCPLNENLGTAVEITIPKEKRFSGAKFSTTVYYETTEESTAIQWLNPNQTADKKHPYMFTQCQAIHCRALLPCQDAPMMKATYSARVSAPSWSECLMSAVASANEADSEPCEPDYKVFTWEQNVPIPSYLIAMVIGCVESREVGPRTKVWGEASIVEAAAYEFEQTEEFICHAEQIMGQEYVWGRYDLVCLPPSFPYGGMENPCLTFVTPTLIAGDRSLADVIAHEIAHSWTGNLITNRTWEHFWLNEGFTVWLQRKIMAKIHGEKYFDFDSIIGWKHLTDSVKNYGDDHPFTVLIPELKGVDPDDSFSSVPYEKGFNFLYYLSKLVGHSSFEEFVKAYVQKFKFGTLTSNDFCDFFKEFFDERGVDYSAVDWEGWMTTPGMPLVTPKFDDSISSECNAAADCWLEGEFNKVSENWKGWTSSQFVVFLERILFVLESNGRVLSVELVEKMNKQYNFGNTRNSEIRFCWQSLCIMSEATFILPDVEAFLKEQGRMKFVRPLFRKLGSSKFGRDVACRLFIEWKLNYHPIAQKMIEKDLTSLGVLKSS